MKNRPTDECSSIYISAVSWAGNPFVRRWYYENIYWYETNFSETEEPNATASDTQKNYKFTVNDSLLWKYIEEGDKSAKMSNKFCQNLMTQSEKDVNLQYTLFINLLCLCAI